MLTITQESAKLNATIRAVKGTLRKSTKQLVTMASKAALRKAINLTPPAYTTRTGITDKVVVEGKEAQRHGEAIVQGDIRRVFPTAAYAYETIKSPAAQSAFWFLLKRGGKKGRAAGMEAAQQILREHSYNVRVRNAPISETLDPSLHESARRRGRVSTRQYAVRIILKESDVKRYIREKQKRVGRLAAGWLSAAEALKVNRVPAWIRRHKGSEGAVEIIETATQCVVVMKNRVAYGPAAQLSRILPYAIASANDYLRTKAHETMLKAMKQAGFTVTAITA